MIAPLRNWHRRALVCVLLTVVLWLAISYTVAYRLTHRTTAIAEPLPAVPWGSAEAFCLTTTDGHQLGAWFFNADNRSVAVVLLHGNGECRTASLPQAKLLVTAGFPVLTVSLRAHGDSTGKTNDFGFSAQHDVVAAVEWLEAAYPGISVVIWGRSLGSAAALFAAGSLGKRVCAYILECPYQDLETAVQNRLRSRLPWGAYHVAYAGLRITAPLVLPRFAEISPYQAASGMPKEMPVLILTGTADERATPAEARAIAEQIGPAARVVVFEGGGHLRLSAADHALYRRTIYDFLEACRTQGR